MLLLAVVPEPFTVVRGDDHDRPVVDADLPEMLEQPADDGVRGGHLSVVRVGVAPPERLGRVPRHVRLVDVEEVEKRPRGMRVQPALREAEGDAPRALLVGEARAVARVERVLVLVEQAGEPRLAPEHVRRDRGPRRVAPRLQQAREVRVPGTVEGEADVVAHAVLRGQEAGEHRDVRRQRHRAGAPRALEEERVPPKAIEMRRLDPRVAVGGQPVGPERVDRDQHDGRLREALGDAGAPTRRRGRDRHPHENPPPPAGPRGHTRDATPAYSISCTTRRPTWGSW